MGNIHIANVGGSAAEMALGARDASLVHPSGGFLYASETKNSVSLKKNFLYVHRCHDFAKGERKSRILHEVRRFFLYRTDHPNMVWKAFSSWGNISMFGWRAEEVFRFLHVLSVSIQSCQSIFFLCLY